MPDQRGGLDEERRNPEASQKDILDLIEELDFQNRLGWGTVVVFAKTVMSSVTDVVLRRKGKKDEIKERIKARTRVILEALEEEARLRSALEKTVEQLTASNKEKAQKIEDLKAAQKALEEVTAMKDSILGIFAHDFRGPLGNIVGVLDSFLNGDLTADDVRSILPMTKERIESLISKMQDLLDLRRFEGGSIAPQMELVEDPKKWMDSVLKNHFKKAEEKGVSLLNKIPESTPAFVTDKAMIRRVVVNLISNAIKFSGEGETIRVSLEDNDGNIIICVSDEGQGMTAEQVTSLWEFGKNSSTPGTAGEKGTGFGMPICHQIVTKVLSGRIEVESTKGEGTTFRVIIPELTTDNVADYV